MWTDYLVKGCGASAMAFVDVMLRETEATFTIVDKRAAPGGHWNDAYPFVKLHQPSAIYGVPSRELGRKFRETTGLNQGLYELASGIQVADYFHQTMQECFLPTGRVKYFPMCELVEGEDESRAEIVSLLCADRHVVEVRSKIVDATLLSASIPLTHKRKFSVTPGVTCIAPNDLPRVAANHSTFTILGAGKTAMDSLLWLLTARADPDSITWVLPRDSWLINQANLQPGAEFFERGLGCLAAEVDNCATAASIEELGSKMEASGLWMRLDERIWPTMIHCARVTELELGQLRRIGKLVRMGHVKRIEPDRIVLSSGELRTQGDALYIDCTASAHLDAVKAQCPVFGHRRIVLQMVRKNLIPFSAALIGYVEASITDESEKQRLTEPVPIADSVNEWCAMMAVTLRNQVAWGRHREIVDWIARCRLDLFSRRVRQITAKDHSKRALLMRMRTNTLPAIQNLTRLSQGRDHELRRSI